MRVLFSSTFGHGHVLPMVPLAQAFREAGHDVRWATEGPALGVVTSAGFDVAPAGLSGEALQTMLAGYRAEAQKLPPQEWAGFMFPHQFGAGLAPPMFADLLPVAEEFKPDLMVHEQGELAAPLVGALVGAGVITHAFGGPVPAPFLSEAGNLLAPLWTQHGLELPPFAGSFSTAYLDICPREVRAVPLDHIPTRYELRPVLYSGENTDLPAAVTQDGPPLVYLTLGTRQKDSEALAAAVQAIRDLPVRLLVSVGPDADPERLGPQPDNVHVEQWVPQSAVLSHCAVVVSHGGSGTFLGALSQAVPQLCLPQAADQFRNAVGGLAAGAVLSLSPDAATPDAMREAVERLLHEESFRAAAQGVARTIASMPSPHEVVTVLEGLLV